MSKKELLNNYLNDNISVFELINEFDNFRNSQNRLNNGIVYTPLYIVEHIINNLDYNINQSILEPSVGHGVFLFSLVNYVEEKFKLTPLELAQWFETYFYAIDISQDNIEDLKEIIKLFFLKKGIKNISTKKITSSDSLFTDFNMTFDCIFGNPPYIRTKNIQPDYLIRIKDKFSFCKTGNIDIYYAFIELAQNISNKYSFIVPNSYIRNNSAKLLRKEIKNDIDYIIDFKNTQVFKSAKTYTSIIQVDKNNKKDYLTYSTELNSNIIFTPKKSDLLENSWDFENNKEFNEKNTKHFSNIRGGIATLKDNIYIIDDTKEIFIEGIVYYQKKHNNETFLIEKNSTVEFKKITKHNNKYKIIFPYTKNIDIMEDSYLLLNFPKLYDYLSACRVVLESRDKGKTNKYPAWFAYGRKQGLRHFDYRYHLLIPKMMTEETKCQIINFNELFLFTSGYVLSSNDLNHLNFLKENIENKKFFDFIKIHGKPWAGKKTYFSFSATTLKQYKF